MDLLLKFLMRRLRLTGRGFRGWRCIAPEPRHTWVLIFAFVLLAFFISSAQAAPRLHPPVSGAIVRPFEYNPAAPFRRGSSRAVALAAVRAEVVRAPCSGRVAFAGRAPSGGPVVSLVCGGYRVVLSPVARLARRADRGVQPPRRAGSAPALPDRSVQAFRAGAPLGVVARGGTLRLSVRRASDRFAYLDPASMLTPGRPPAGPPPVPPARPRGSPPPVWPGQPASPAAGRLRVPAPWPVWAGLTIVLLSTARAGRSWVTAPSPCVRLARMRGSP